MKRIITGMLIIFFAACKDNEGPDVSGIAVNINIHRFDRFLFEKLDTNNMVQGLQQMQESFPFFAGDFMQNILGLPFNPAMSPDSGNHVITQELKRFITLSRPLYDSLGPEFKNTEDLEEELKYGFQHVKYYYPSYKVPEVVTYVGPFDAPAVAITTQALAIGLQLYGGKNFSFYTSTQGQELYPAYISRRFEPEYIPANAMTAVVEDIHPFRVTGKPLIEQMIMKGKQWWMLDKLLP